MGWLNVVAAVALAATSLLAAAGGRRGQRGRGDDTRRIARLGHRQGTAWLRIAQQGRYEPVLPAGRGVVYVGRQLCDRRLL